MTSGGGNRRTARRSDYREQARNRSEYLPRVITKRLYFCGSKNAIKGEVKVNFTVPKLGTGSV